MMKNDNANYTIKSSIEPTNAGAGILSPKKLYKRMLKKYPDVLNVSQVCEVLGVSIKTVYKLINSGTLESLKIGRSYKVPKLFLLRYLKIIDH